MFNKSDDQLYEYVVKSDEAYAAAQYSLALEYLKKAEDLCEDENIKFRIRLQQGSCYEALREEEKAIETYLELATTSSANIDVKYVCVANERIVNWAIENKPLVFINKTIHDYEHYILRTGQDLEYSIFYLKGNLEAERGDYSEALRFFIKTWRELEIQGETAHYTNESYLSSICRSAFFSKNQNALKKYYKVMERLPVHCERCRCMRYQSKLWCLRSNLNYDDNKSEALHTSIEFLRHLKVLDIPVGSYHTSALRAKMLCGNIEEVEHEWFELKSKIKEHKSWEDLFEGDLMYNQARSFLNMDIEDNQWHEEIPVQLSQHKINKNVHECLDNAKHCYEKALEEDVKEDKRLETSYYSDTIRERLRRVYNIRISIH